MKEPESTQAAVRVLAEPVTVRLGGRDVRVESLDQVEELLGEMVRRAEGAAERPETRRRRLSDDAATIQDALKRLVTGAGFADDVFAELGLEFFVEDDGWRELAASVASLAAQHDELKVLALARYRRYLLALVGPGDLPDPDTGPDSGALPAVDSEPVSGSARTRAFGRNRAGGEDAGDDEGDDGFPSLDDSILDALVGADPTAESGAVDSGGPDPTAIAALMRAQGCRRLPRGVEVLVRGGDAEPAELPVWLAAWCFTLRHGQAAVLVDDAGVAHPLRDGQNLVGRALYNDVVLDERFSQISRRHLIVNVQAGRVYSITDVSSQGTFVPRHAFSAPGDSRV